MHVTVCVGMCVCMEHFCVHPRRRKAEKKEEVRRLAVEHFNQGASNPA